MEIPIVKYVTAALVGVLLIVFTVVLLEGLDKYRKKHRRKKK